MSGLLTGRSALHHYGPNRNAEHFVYRIYDAGGVLLYIGCTINVKRRVNDHLGGHSKAGKWLSVSLDRYEVEGPFRGRDAGREAERRAIKAERPLFNTQERKDVGVAVWSTRRPIQVYLVEHGHLQLALDTICTCWPEAKALGAFDSWCYTHEAAQVAGITNLRPASELTDAEWEVVS